MSQRPCLVVALLVVGACRSQAPAAVRLRQSPARSVLDVTPAEMRSVIGEEFRLNPDRRFLIAVAEINRLITGRSPGEVSAEYVNDAWHVRSGPEDVGSLPPLPGYRSVDSLLGVWAVRVAQRSSWQLRPGGATDSIRAALHDFEAPRVAQALRQIDQAWRSAPSAELAVAAAQGLGALMLQLEDQLEVADQLAGKALAATALARALAPAADPRDPVLLAAALGYSVEAAELAQALPDSDPVRLYLQRRTALLGAAATRPEAEPRTRFLYLRRLAGERDTKAWQDWVAQPWYHGRTTSGVLGTGLAANRFELDVVVPRRLARVVNEELAQALNGSGWWARLGRAAGPLQRFERDLNRLGGRFRGPFLDGPTLAAYFRGHMFSALYAEATHDLEGLASVDASRAFAQTLAEAPAGPAAALGVWTDRSAQYMAGQVSLIDLIADMDTLEFPGEPAMERTFQDVTRRLPYADPRIFDAARRLARSMDTRVSHQAELAGVAYEHLLDLSLAERFYRRVVELAAPDYPGFEAWYARWRGADTSLVRMLEDTTLNEEYRAQALQYLLEGEYVNDSAVRAEFQRLVASHPDRWYLREQYVKYLEKRHVYRDAVPVVLGWLDTHPLEGGFDYIAARTTLARLYDALGRVADAWSAIEPVIESYQAGAMGRGALILSHLGRGDEAEQLARKLVDRYPDSPWGRATLAEVLWRQGADDQAAAGLHQARRLFGLWDWRRDIGEAFLRVFGGQPATAGARAVAALARAGVPAWELEEIAVAASKAGRAELAFALQSELKGTSNLGSLEIAVKAYTYLKAWRGEQAARTWLRSQIPGSTLSPASMTFYREEQFDLLWDLIGDPGPGDVGTFVWLLRAAAPLERSAGRDPHRAALREYYGQARTDPYFVMGRYLIGLADERAMLALATTPDRRCEVSYYLGVRAKSEGRYADASDWFRVARETEQRKEGEYVWATDEVTRWVGKGRSLSLLGGQ